MNLKDNAYHITLYALSVIASGCGFVTQMLISGFWSTTYSHDVLFFSVNTAIYFLSLGIGSLNSSRWNPPSIKHLFNLTLFLCLWTGISILLLKLGIRTYGNVILFPFGLVFVSGFVSGQVVPLTIRLSRKEHRIRLSTLFFFDYTAAIFFTLLFTFVLLIPLGYTHTSLVLAYSCLGITSLLLWLSKTFYRNALFLGLAALALPLALIQFGKPVREAPTWRGGLRGETAKILINEQSHYQKIVLTEEKGSNPFLPDLTANILYLDGFIQFNSLYEQNYHFCLANIPAMAVTENNHEVKNALVLGGGDGLVARNLLSISTLKHIDQVELDPRMIELAKTHPVLKKFNRNAFEDPRVNLIPADAFRWVRKAQPGHYDLIIIDFPDPKNITLSRLYTAEFYSYVLKLLHPKGVLSIQSGPIFALEDASQQTISRMPTTIVKTLASVRQNAFVYYSPRDHDAYVMATKNQQFDMGAFSKKIGIHTDASSAHLCRYRQYWKVPPVQINTLNTLTLSDYLLDWYATAGGSYFERSGNYAIFLPE